MQIIKNAVFIDTGAFAALFLEKDLNHEKSVSLFEVLKNSRQSMYTSDYIVDETVTLISSKESHSKATAFLYSIRQSKIVKMVPVFDQYFSETCDSFEKYNDKGFSFTDVSSVIIMKKLGLRTAFAFDKHFVQAGFEILS